MYLGMEMEEKIIRKDEFHNLLAKLTENYQVFAPVSKGKLVVFEEIHAEDEISLDYSNAEKSVKELFFPQRERLFTFNIPQGNEIREPAPSDKKRVILGIRPCDARSVSLLDNVFDDKVYQDPYYLNKRKNTLIVAIGCNHPESTCFCTSTEGDPFSTDGSDVLLVDIGDSYLVQTVTEKGGSFLEQQKALFKKANEEHTRLREKIVEKARTSITSQANLGELKKKLESKSGGAKEKAR